MSHSFSVSRRYLVSTAAALAASALWIPGRASAAVPVVVEIENGRLRGQQQDGVISFKGVPYAADTGGRNRFMAPRPVASWAGVRDALQFGQRSPQGRGPSLPNAGPAPAFGEDCCVLNVYTTGADPRARRPVMVWFHGGGFEGGSGEVDGANLASRGDVVVVTVNHRLNVLGYMNLGLLDPEFADADNAGQLDLIAALKWVKGNIAVFGGDPQRVTVFGQSGGGSKISVLMVMPGAKGLFRNAINMSGSSAFAMKTAPEMTPVTVEFLKTLGIARGELRKLQEAPPEKLLAAHRIALEALKAGSYRPVVDARHLHHKPLSPEGLAMHAAMPQIMSSTSDEAGGEMSGDPRNLQVTMDQLKARIAGQFGLDVARAGAVVEAYREEDPGRTPFKILVAVASDAKNRTPQRRAAEAKASLGQAPVYMEEFAWRSPATGFASHGADVAFAFGNVDRDRRLANAGPAVAQLSRAEMAAFTTFARTGSPNNPSIPTWAPFNLTRRPTMVMDERIRLVDDFRAADRRASDLLPLQDAFDIRDGPLFGQVGGQDG